MANLMENDSTVHVIIPKNETKDDVTHYIIEVSVGEVTWTVSHRYNDFTKLHDVLVSDHCIMKELLPQKKLIGNRAPEFIEKRTLGLEIYLQTVLRYLQKAMPLILLDFLDFDKYEITHVLRGMADQLCSTISPSLDEFSFNPLQLHSLNECLQKCLPSELTNCQHDLSHILEFCNGLNSVCVRGSTTKIGTSNLIYNNLHFCLNVFKSAKQIYLYDVNMCNIDDIRNLRQTVNSIVVYNSNIRHFVDVLMCDRIHKTCENEKDKWSNLTLVDFSWNKIKRIDKSVELMPNVQKLTMDGNQISKIENINMLSTLTHLCLSANNISVENCLYEQLKNLTHLNMSQNRINTLKPFNKLRNLRSLDLGSNLVSESNDIKNISSLSRLDNLVLTGNPVSTIIDYRIKVFEFFGERAKDLCLDNERPSQKELDAANLFRALTVVREGKSPQIIMSS